MSRPARRLLAAALVGAVLAAGPTAAALAQNAGDQQYVDPFANEHGSKQKPKSEQKPSTRSQGGSQGSSGSSGSSGSGSSGSSGSGSSGSSGSGGARSGKHSGGSSQGGAALPSGSPALLALAERLPVIGAALRADETSS